MNQQKDQKYTTMADFKPAAEETKYPPKSDVENYAQKPPRGPGAMPARGGIPAAPASHTPAEYLPRHKILPKQSAEVPQRSRHMMKFCIAEKDNKLLKRDVRTSDHLDMYTSKVNNTNARVNINMQTRRAQAAPAPTAAYPVHSHGGNVLMQKHGRENLIRAPFM